MALSKAVYVFIPGAWHIPDTFDGIRALLKKQGYESHAVATPSVGAKPPNKGLYDDADYTHEKLADEGKQIVVVTHSIWRHGGLNSGGRVGLSSTQAFGQKGRRYHVGVHECICSAQR